jgi:hypothetical protein
LPFRVLARSYDGLFAGRFETALAVEVRPQLTIADGTHRRHVGAKIASRAQPLDFRHEAARYHRVESLLDALGELYPALGHECNRENAWTVSLFAQPLQLGDRPACQSMDFERSLDTLPIVRCDAIGRFGIHCSQTVVQRGPAKLRCFAVERCADGAVRPRQYREPVP